jgi:hypothetical protein
MKVTVVTSVGRWPTEVNVSRDNFGRLEKVDGS